MLPTSQGASGAVCAGSNPAGGTLYEVPKDPVTSGNAEAGVFAYVQPDAARSDRVSGPWTGSWHIAAGHCRIPETTCERDLPGIAPRSTA